MSEHLAVILGYGSAGRRHAGILRKRGFKVISVDPWVPDSDFRDLSEVKGAWDVAVVATPPALHVPLCQLLMERGGPILCEKPLSGFENRSWEIPELKGVKFGFNWRFHHRLSALGLDLDAPAFLVSVQTRTRLPPWGLLLDHVSHDFDILSLSSGLRRIDHARGSRFGWAIQGTSWGNQRVIILDLAFPSERKFRVSFLLQGTKFIWLDPDPRMHERMWDDFFDSQERICDFWEAVFIQSLLEEANRLAPRFSL